MPAAAGEPPRAGAFARKDRQGARAHSAQGAKGKGKGAARTEGIATRLPAPADFSRSGFLPRPGAF